MIRIVIPALLLYAAVAEVEDYRIGQSKDRGSFVTCPQVTSLHCRNGSVCEAGVATFGSQHDHLGLQTHESGYYCKCMEGYIGHECELEVEDCDGDTGYDPSDPTGVLQSCYHGSRCQTSDNGFYCDCKTLNESTDPTASKFAGLMCQHESTSLCAATLTDKTSPNHQFCTNHGKCVKMVTGGQPHPGCVCKEGYSGDHCELRTDPFANISKSISQEQAGGNNTTGSIILFSLLITTLVSVLAYIGLLVYRGWNTEEKIAEAVKNLKVLSVGDLEPDGSGTLGSPTKKAQNGDGNEGDVELSTPKKAEPIMVGDRNFDIGCDDGEEVDKLMTEDGGPPNMEIC